MTENNREKTQIYHLICIPNIFFTFFLTIHHIHNISSRSSHFEMNYSEN